MIGGQFRLDVEAVPTVVAVLREARDNLAALHTELDRLADPEPVGDDEVSRNVLRQLRRLGLGAEPGSLTVAVHTQLAALDATITALDDMVGEYRQADEFALPPGAGVIGPRPGW